MADVFYTCWYLPFHIYHCQCRPYPIACHVQWIVFLILSSVSESDSDSKASMIFREMFLRWFSCTSDTCSVAVSFTQIYRVRKVFVYRTFLFTSYISGSARISLLLFFWVHFPLQFLDEFLLLFRYSLYEYTFLHQECSPLSSTPFPFKSRQLRSVASKVAMTSGLLLRSGSIRLMQALECSPPRWTETPCAIFPTAQGWPPKALLMRLSLVLGVFTPNTLVSIISIRYRDPKIHPQRLAK